MKRQNDREQTGTDRAFIEERQLQATGNKSGNKTGTTGTDSLSPFLLPLALPPGCRPCLVLHFLGNCAREGSPAAHLRGPLGFYTNGLPAYDGQASHRWRLIPASQAGSPARRVRCASLGWQGVQGMP